MTVTRLFRIGGLTVFVGAIAFGVHLVARSVITAGADPATFAREALWVPINALGVLGAALVLLGLPALYARMAGATGPSALLGVALIALAWMFFGVFLSLYSALVAPWLADEAPALVAASAPLPTAIIVAFLAATVAELVGTVLLAIPFLKGGARPRWVGYVLPASALLRVIGSLIAPSGPASDLAVNLLSNLGPLLLLVALGHLGVRLSREARSGRERSVGAGSFTRAPGVG